MNFMYNRFIRDRIYSAIARQEEITKLQLVFPAYHQYKSNPTFQQMEELVDIAEKMECRTDELYHIFASGKIPDWLDTIIKDLSANWQPSGDIVDGSVDVKQISSPPSPPV